MYIWTLTRKKDFNVRDYSKRAALEGDYSSLVKCDTLFMLDGKPTALYMQMPQSLDRVRQIVTSIKYQKSERTGGLKTVSRVFGYQPRIALRRDFCTATSLSREDPEANATICDVGRQISDIYKTYFPNVHQSHLDQSKKVLPEWQIEQTPFTSGIINKNNPLKYHYDAGNFPGVCSCMLGFKRDIGGGYLAMPEFDLALEIADGSLTIFDGQSILHGVTPICRVTPSAYRYTIVYYALAGMWKCEPLSVEVNRIRNIKNARERKRARDSFVLDQNGTMLGADENSKE